MATLPSKTQIAITFGSNDAPAAPDLMTFTLDGLFTLRGFLQAGEPWFVAADACIALDIGNTTQALARLDADEQALISIEGLSRGNDMVNIVNESGLYSLILGSRKPSAKKFKKWVTSEVLPSIRKTGGYSLPAAQPSVALPHDFISALEHLLESKKAEQLAIEQRDEAIRTKALIGSQREATAMATASAKAREAARLKHELGYSARHATILQVEKKLKRDFDFHPLRRWCNQNHVKPEAVPDKRYGEAKAWPAAAWQTVYGVDLAQLFGEEE